jgi:hypothetical protein
VHRHTGTASMRSRQSVLFSFLTQWILPLYLDWLNSGSQFARNWLKFDTGPGEGLTFAVWQASLVGKWGLTRNQKKNPELQAVKTLTHFGRKDCFLHSSHSFYFPFFSSNSFNIIWLSISAVLNNCLVRAVSMSLGISPYIQAITQHPIKAIAPNTTMRDVRIEVISPFYFPNHCSVS